MGKILVIDDNMINLMLLEDVLALHDHSCKCCLSVMEGLEVFRENDYDLVLMDIEMPKINGIEGLKMFRDLKKDTKVFAVTANAYAEQVKIYTMLGFDEVITKPFAIGDVLQKVERGM